jgi:hypothetical protein
MVLTGIILFLLIGVVLVVPVLIDWSLVSEEDMRRQGICSSVASKLAALGAEQSAPTDLDHQLVCLPHGGGR